MSYYKWIIDAGHGGMSANGAYTTAPKKMFRHPNFTIYEGVINRGVAKHLISLMISGNLDFALIYEEEADTSLGLRAALANKIATKEEKSILLSIHSNAGGGEGLEVFTTKGVTKSDKIAQLLCDFYITDFPEFKFRTDKADNDSDKEADFYIIKNVVCPAVLVENFFFDNEAEARLLMTSLFQKRIAQTLYKWMKHVEAIKPI
jgi:N-acetylmuramoyl-L-alanine amidase